MREERRPAIKLTVPFPDIHTKSFPGKRLLEDSLTKIAGKEEPVGARAPEGSEESH